jgi:hypothetical protein
MIQAIFYEKNYKNIITKIYLILLKNLIPIIKNRSYFQNSHTGSADSHREAFAVQILKIK